MRLRQARSGERGSLRSLGYPPRDIPRRGADDSVTPGPPVHVVRELRAYLRGGILALAARRRRWPSFNRSARPLSCSFSTRCDSIRYSRTSPWRRFIQTASDAIRTCSGWIWAMHAPLSPRKCSRRNQLQFGAICAPSSEGATAFLGEAWSYQRQKFRQIVPATEGAMQAAASIGIAVSKSPSSCMLPSMTTSCAVPASKKMPHPGEIQGAD